MDRATAWALGLAVAATLAISPAARAAEWTVAPMLSLGLDYDTNRALTVPAIPSGGLSMSFDTHFDRDTERLQLDLHPQAQLDRYTNAQLSHSDDEAIDATATWLNTERSSLSVHTLIRDADTIYSELTQTGIIHFGQRRLDEEANGTWSYQQTERWTLQLQGSYSGSKYHGTGVSNLSNYHQSLGSVVESFAYTERLILSVNGSAGDAQTTGSEQSTRFESAGLGFQWQPTERVVISGSGGASRQKTGTLSSTSVIGELSASYNTELGHYTLTAQQQLQPTGFGIFTQVDQVTLAASRQIAPRLSLDYDVSAYRDTSAFQSPLISFTFADHTYSETHLRLSWRESEPWTLALQLLYDRNDEPRSILFAPEGFHAHGWQVSLDSTWAPNGASLSR